MEMNILKKKLVVANIGLERFYLDLKKQNVRAVNLDWKPPAGGNRKTLDLLARMKKAGR